jgi:hypothetical protein
MRCALLAALVLLAPAPSLAQKQVVPPPGVAEPAPAPPPGGVAVGADGRMIMSSAVCTALAGLAPAVPGADYVPGVDVNGDAVAPADLPGSAPPLVLENFPIEIGVNLKKRFGVSAGSQFFRGKPIVGLVTVREGDAYFNGAKLAQNERDLLLAACKETKR